MYRNDPVNHNFPVILDLITRFNCESIIVNSKMLLDLEPEINMLLKQSYDYDDTQYVKMRFLNA